MISRFLLALALIVCQPALGLATSITTTGAGSAVVACSGATENFTVVGTDTISIPAGCVSALVHCVAGGGSGGFGGGARYAGGGGGGFAEETNKSLAGLSAIFISVPDGGATNTSGAGEPGGDCFAKENNSGGTDIVRATGGGAGLTSGGTATGAAGAGTVGDTLNSGGSTSWSGSNGGSGGGGGAGSSGNGGSVSSSATGGSGGTGAVCGGSAGNGGNGRGTGDAQGQAGGNFGGGGGAGNITSSLSGGQGCVQIVWS